jgi:dsDNA-binding SOS-regulon protein
MAKYYVRREVVEWYEVEAESAQDAWDRMLDMQRPTDSYIEAPTTIYREADEEPTTEEWEERDPLSVPA